MRWAVSILIALFILIAVIVIFAATMNMAAVQPGSLESRLMTSVKKWRIDTKDVGNPLPDNADTQKEGAKHFQHHCQICHGLDGQNTGVPLADRMSPPVANLASGRVQNYTDGQLKWIVDNGIRFTGMPGWKGIVSDEEGWAIVRYLRHLPAKGSLGAPKVFEEGDEEHEHTHDQEKPAEPQHQHPH